MAIVHLALASLWNRRIIAGLVMVTIALSVTMLLGVEKLRRDARGAFTHTISGTDLVVGARSGAIPLLLYSVFRIGNATNNISWNSYQEIAALAQVKWTVPLSLGDSHRGFRVLGTTTDYFQYYQYANRQALQFAAGNEFKEAFDAVLGAQVARQLGYQLQDNIIIAHGAGEVNFIKHEDKPFRVTGILHPTGTPVDQTVHISLKGIEALHIDWQKGAPRGIQSINPDEISGMDLTPQAITAFLVGLNSKIAIFGVQRHINQFRKEPLLAIIPGIALQELWGLLGVAENVLRIMSLMVVITGLLGMATIILSSLEARRREIAVLRSVGARAWHVFGLFISEAGLLALGGIALGAGLFYGLNTLVASLIVQEFGLHLPITPLVPYDYLLLGAVFLAGLVSGVAPAWRAYRVSLADGLSIKL